MSFIGYYGLKLLLLNLICSSGCKVVRHDKDTSTIVKLVLSSLEQLNLLPLDRRQPLYDFVSPGVLQTAWTHNQQWPVDLKKVHNSYSLNGLTNSHLIAKQNSAKLLSSELDALFLELV